MPYCRRVTTQIWVGLLIGCAAWKICFSQSGAPPRSWWSGVISMEFLHLFLRFLLWGNQGWHHSYFLKLEAGCKRLITSENNAVALMFGCITGDYGDHETIKFFKAPSSLLDRSMPSRKYHKEESKCL